MGSWSATEVESLNSQGTPWPWDNREKYQGTEGGQYDLTVPLLSFAKN